MSGFWARQAELASEYTESLGFAFLTWNLALSYYPAELGRVNPILYWVLGAVTAILL